jgi:predicted dehydrogenase
MPTPLRIVLAGCGGISAAWLNAIKSQADVDMVGFVDINVEAAQKRASEYGWDRALTSTDLAAVLDQTHADIVFDCTVPEAHHPVTLTALAHGCHVLGEKPMSDSMETAREMVAAAQKAGRLYAVTQTRRYDVNIRRLRAFLDSGAIGEITTLNADFYIGAHFGGFRDHMRHVLVLDMAIHTFDAARLICAQDPLSVYCLEWNPQASWYDHDASAAAIFRMTNGVVFNYRGSWCSEGLNTTWEADWRVIGTRGSVRWNGSDSYQVQKVASSGGFFSTWEDLVIPEIDDPGPSGHAGAIAEFLDCVRSGAIPETIASDNIRSLAMVQAAIQSSETGLPVEIKI